MLDSEKYQVAVVDTLNQIKLASFLIAACLLAVVWKLYMMH